MSTPSGAVELACHSRAMRTSLPGVVGELSEVLGSTLVAYIGGVRETRAVRQWAEGSRVPSRATARRLRLAYEVASCIAEREGREVAQAWFQGLNPLLDEVSPARLLREGDVDRDGPSLVRAERAFLVDQ